MFRSVSEKTNWRAVVLGWAVAIAAGIVLNLLFEAAGEHLRRSNEEFLRVMFRRRIRSIGAISALRGSETSGSQSPSIETAGTGPRRPTLALAFAALYFHLDATGSCGQLGCPEFSQANAPASIELPHGVLIAVIAGFPAAALAGLIRRRFASDRKPAEVYLSRARPASTSGCLVRFPGLYRRRSLLRRSRGS